MKKTIAIILATSTILSLAACSSGKQAASTDSPSQSSSGDSANKEKRIKVSAMNILYTAAYPDKSSGMKIIEDKYNFDYSYIPVTAADYVNKLGVAVASGDIPDLTVIPLLNENWYNYLEGGVFMPLEKYINPKDTPNLAKVPKEVMDAMTYNGHIYGLPRLRPFSSHTLTIRKDWLDKLGLKMPTTYDELYDVMKAFTEQDPDGNGKKDTYGLASYINTSGSGGLGSVSLLGSFHTSTNITWSEAGDGKIYPQYVHPNFRQSLEYLRKLYKDGILSKDFVVMKPAQAEEDFLTGKAGMHDNLAWNAYTTERLAKARSINPNFQWAPVPALKGPDGFQGYAKGIGFNGFIAIPATLSKDEAKVKRLLKFVDDQMADDINSDPFRVLNYGKEGVHYNVVDGQIVYTDLGNKERPYWYLITNPPLEYQLNDPSVSQEIRDVRNASYKAALVGTPYSDPSAKMIPSPTLKSKGMELNKSLFENIVKVITGEQPIEFYDKSLADWKAKGGQQILNEMNEAYKSNKAK